MKPVFEQTRPAERIQASKVQQLKTRLRPEHSTLLWRTLGACALRAQMKSSFRYSQFNLYRRFRADIRYFLKGALRNCWHPGVTRSVMARTLQSRHGFRVTFFFFARRHNCPVQITEWTDLTEVCPKYRRNYPARTVFKNFPTSIFRLLLSLASDCADASTCADAKPVLLAPRCASVTLLAI
jgi:hypothetical protein